MAKAENFKFYTLVAHMMFSLIITNCPSNGHVTNFKSGAPSHNSGMTEAAVVKFCTHIGHTEFVVLG